MEKILITGGSGLVGRHLSVFLKNAGYDVMILGRQKSETSGFQSYQWNYKTGEIDIEAVKSADYIIHLAGSNIAENRWTAQEKQTIIDSRVKTGELLYKTVKEHNPNLKAYISASAIGYYGAVTTARPCEETDKPGNDFLSEICQKWEKPVGSFSKENIRTSIIRIGVVLAESGGPLEKIMKPIKLGFGSPIGTGKQYMGWIHIEDLCKIFLHLIKNKEYSGIYNAVSPEHITNAGLTKKIAEILGKKLWLPNVPVFVAKLLFGEAACTFLEGSPISSEKIRHAGFQFSYPEIESALTNLIKNEE